MDLFERLQADLEQRKIQGNYRELPMASFRQDNILFDSVRYIDLSSNDYLCIARDSHFINEFFATFTDKEASGSQFAQQILNSFIGSGSTGSRLLTGNQIAYTYCEDLLASLFSRVVSCPWSPDSSHLDSSAQDLSLSKDQDDKAMEDLSLDSFARLQAEGIDSKASLHNYDSDNYYDHSYESFHDYEINGEGETDVPKQAKVTESDTKSDKNKTTKSGKATKGKGKGHKKDKDALESKDKEAQDAKGKGLKGKNSLNQDALGFNAASNKSEDHLIVLSAKESVEQEPVYSADGQENLASLKQDAPNVIKRTRSLDQQDMVRDCLYLNSGFDANHGILSTLFGEKDLLLVDKLAHASMIDGMLSSKAKAIRYAHNDMDHLEHLLQLHAHKYENVVIVTEAVFSMDGDRANLPSIVNFKQQYPNLLIYVDEAHSFGLLGEGGLGLCQELNVLDKVDFIMGTLSKAIGSQGAFLICPRVVKQYLINHMRNFIYSTALPPFNVAFSMYIIGMLNTTVMQYRRDYLNKICNYLHLNLLEMDLTPSESQIQPLITGDNNKAAYMSEVFKRAGLLVLPIRHPTVPINQVRLRMTLNCNLRIDDVDAVCNLIKRHRGMFVSRC